MAVEMTAEAIAARLRTVAELSRSGASSHAVDMRPAAISARLRECSDLSELCARLGELGRSAGLGPRRSG